MNKVFIRQYSLVKFNIDGLDPLWQNKYPFEKDRIYIFFGEIPNMLGHCIVMDYITGKIHSGYHIDNFMEVDDVE